MELLILWTLPFWIVAFALWVILTIAIDWENGAFATGTLFIGLGALWWFSGFHPITLSWFEQNWLGILLTVVGYIIIAPAWAYINWRVFFLNDKGDDYEAKRADYQAAYVQFQKDCDKTFANWKARDSLYVDQRKYTDYKSWLSDNYNYPPMPGKNKSLIFLWMFYWPVSAIWTLIHKPIKRIFNAFYQAMVAVYTRTSQQAFGARFTELK